MVVKTIYCVQTYRGSRTRLALGALQQFGHSDEALQRAEEIKDRVAGCAVLRVRGDPSIDCWEEPEVLATFGLVPEPAA